MRHESLVVFGGMVHVVGRDFVVGNLGLDLSRELDSFRATAGSVAVGGAAIRFDIFARVHVVHVHPFAQSQD